jgi:predicted RNase H-like HicB family nuclease
MTTLKIVVEKHPDGYVAYPLGIDGVVVGQGDTFDEALDDVKSGIAFHLDTFGSGALDQDSDLVEVLVTEASPIGCRGSRR